MVPPKSSHCILLHAKLIYCTYTFIFHGKIYKLSYKNDNCTQASLAASQPITRGPLWLTLETVKIQAMLNLVDRQLHLSGLVQYSAALYKKHPLMYSQGFIMLEWTSSTDGIFLPDLPLPLMDSANTDFMVNVKFSVQALKKAV